MAETINSRYTFQNTNLDTKKLKFLSGLQDNLNGLISSGGAVEGAFYLTTDTHRLYIGRTVTAENGTSITAKTIPIPVNEGITTVANTTALYNSNANVGEFYYIEDGNILAVRAKSGNGTGAEYWVQLNNDTDQTIEVIATGTGFSAGTYDSTNHRTTYNLTIKQDKINRKTNSVEHLTDIVIPLTITDAQIQSAISVGFGSTAVSNNSTTLSVSGNGAASSGNSVTLKGAGSVALSGGNGSDITITGKQYTLSKKSDANTTIQLKEDTTDKGTVKFGVKSNTENLAVDGATSGEINYYHTGAGAAVKVSGTENVDYKGNNTAGPVSMGSSFNVPKISRDANGHIVSIEDIALSLPSATAYTPKNLNADNTGKLTLEMNNGDKYYSTTNNPSGKTGVLYHTLTVDGTASTVYNQGNLGTFYSASKVDEKIATALKGLDAMTYIGTVGSTSSTIGSATLPTSNVSIGDTYLADINGNMTGYTYATGEVGKKGDLYIARSSDNTENSSGYIDSAKLVWTHVEAGENDTTYEYKGSTGSNPTAQLDDSHNATKGKIQFIGGDHVLVTGGLVSGKTDEWTFTVDHDAAGTATTTKAPASSTGTASINLSNGGKLSIPGFSIDDKGHVTATSDTIVALPTIADYALNYNTSSSATSSNREAKIHLWKGTSGAGTIAIDGDGGKISTEATSTGIKISHTKLNSIPTTTNASTPIPSGGMTVVTGVGYDDYGHISSYETSTFTVPTALSYSLLESTYDTTHVSWKVRDSGNSDHGIIDLASSSLTFGRSSAGNFTADIVWGSFDPTT